MRCCNTPHGVRGVPGISVCGCAPGFAGVGVFGICGCRHVSGIRERWCFPGLILGHIPREVPSPGSPPGCSKTLHPDTFLRDKLIRSQRPALAVRALGNTSRVCLLQLVFRRGEVLRFWGFGVWFRVYGFDAPRAGRSVAPEPPPPVPGSGFRV